MTTRRTMRIWTLVVGAALLLAACGSSGGDDASYGGGDKKTTTTAASDGGDATTTTAGSTDTGDASSVASVTEDPDLGPILVDGAGRTLYTLTDDNGDAVDCEDACQQAWPPAEVAASADLGTIEGVELGTAEYEGKTLLSADGLPLYLFSGDTASGDANGEGIASFGGTWHVVKISS